MTKKKKDNIDSVVLIEDPFQISTLDIAEAQRLADAELELDSDLEDLTEMPEMNEQDLEQLEKAISAIQNQDLESQTSDSDFFDTEKELAAQIAEDQALQAQEKADQQAAEDEAQNIPILVLTEVTEVQAALEAILFLADRPLSEKKLRETLGEETDRALIQQALDQLLTHYQDTQHGIELCEISGGYQFRTKPAQAGALKKLTKIQFQRLSRGAMESLAIIAYRQPVLKDEIDKIRGVDSSYFLRLLMERNIIQISGRSDLPGRPILYSTTDHFLQLFGLKDLSALPPLSEIEQMVPQSEAGRAEADEDPHVKKMRALVSKMNLDPSGNLGYNPSEDEVILKEIKERVAQVSVTTPYLEAEKEVPESGN